MEKDNLAKVGLVIVGTYLTAPFLYRGILGLGAIFHMVMTGGMLPPPPPRPPKVMRNLPLWKSLDQEIQGMEKSWPGYFGAYMQGKR